jgi:hypothetical protein
MSFKAFSTALVALALAACSSQPQEPSASAPAATPAAAAPAANLTPATASPATASSEDKKPVLSRALISAGYKATTVKGEILYCRSEDVIGTRFKRKVCLNEAQLRDQERRIKEMQDQMIRSQASPPCTPMPTCAG